MTRAFPPAAASWLHTSSRHIVGPVSNCRIPKRLRTCTLQLPMHPGLTEDQQDYILAQLDAIIARPVN